MLPGGGWEGLKGYGHFIAREMRWEIKLWSLLVEQMSQRKELTRAFRFVFD